MKAAMTDQALTGSATGTARTENAIAGGPMAEDATGPGGPVGKRPEPRISGLGTYAALPGAAIGFCGTFTYLLLWIVWQLNVGSSTGSVAAALLPHPAQWVTTLAYFTAYGIPSSAVLGAVLGLLVGWVLGRTRSSSSPALGWVFGTVGAFIIGLLVHALLIGTGLRVGFAQSARLFALPTMIYILGGGILGVWLQQSRRRMVDEFDDGEIDDGEADDRDAGDEVEVSSAG